MTLCMLSDTIACYFASDGVLAGGEIEQNAIRANEGILHCSTYRQFLGQVNDILSNGYGRLAYLEGKPLIFCINTSSHTLVKLTPARFPLYNTPNNRRVYPLVCCFEFSENSNPVIHRSFTNGVLDDEDFYQRVRPERTSPGIPFGFPLRFNLNEPESPPSSDDDSSVDGLVIPPWPPRPPSRGRRPGTGHPVERSRRPGISDLQGMRTESVLYDCVHSLANRVGFLERSLGT